MSTILQLLVLLEGVVGRTNFNIVTVMLILATMLRAG